MKEIIYLDETFLNSFISQAYDGLPVQKQTEHTNSFGDQGTDSVTEKGELNGKLNLGIVASGGKYDTTETNQLTTFETDETKDIVSKKIHDNALDDLENTLKDKNKLFSDVTNRKFGDYVKIETTFQLNDLDEFLSTLNDTTLEAYKVAVEEDIRTHDTSTEILIQSQDLSRKDGEQQKREYKKDKKQEIENTKYNFNLISSYISFATENLPTSIFMKAPNSIIPLNRNNLRESSSSLNFKYNHNDLDPKIFILGKVTKKTTNMNIFDLRMFKDKGLGTMYEGFNDVFTELFKLFDILNKNEYVISPIAVYFEDDIL